MNNNFVKFAIVGIACAAFCTTTFAAPKGGPRGGTGHQARAPQQTRTHQAARPAAKPSAPKHAAPARHVDRPAVARHEHPRTEPRHHAPPTRFTRHHVPDHAHCGARPAVPPWRVGALRAWEWIAEEWMIVVNGVYYCGDGYYFDGYNYYYNGECHTVPPPALPMYV